MVKVLVTGITSHAAPYTVFEFIKKGYEINATLRDLSKAEEVKQMLKNSGDLTEAQLNKITLFQADLDKKEGWEEAISGCDYVVHIAYPFINFVPLEELYDAAVVGSLNLLKLAEKTPSVKHFVFCSSAASIGYNESYPEGTVIDDSFVTSKDSKVLDGYMTSKIICDEEYWKIIYSDENKSGLTLTTLHPGGITGPVPYGYKKFVGALMVVDTYTKGGLGKAFNAYINTTDVVDFAKANVAAVENESAHNQKILVLDDQSLSPEVTVDIIRKYSPPEIAAKVPTEFGPVWLSDRKFNINKAKEILGYNPTNYVDSFKATVQGVLKNRDGI